MILSTSQISILLAISATGSFLTCVFWGFSLLLLDRRQKLAYQGDTHAAKKLILPCYRPLYIGLTLYFFALAITQYLCFVQEKIVFEEIYFILQLHSLCLLSAFLICPLLFLQHSVSNKGFIMTILTILPWFSMSLVCVTLIYWNRSWYVVPQIIFLFLTFLPTFLLAVGILSRTIVSRIRLGSRSNRNTVEHLLVFVIIFSLLNLLGIINPDDQAITFALLLTYTIITLLWSIIFVLSTHRSLLADTKYWRGLGTHNRGGITADAQVNDLPHPNMEVSVASTVFQEMMSHIGDYLIDFAFLEAKKRIGEGSTSIVYSGQYKKETVAIKMSTPAEITTEVLEVFMKEAELSASLKHENIVRFIGLCVRPPQIAFVNEYCEEGNLKASLTNKADEWELNFKLRACLDACKALECVHNKNLIHRDIKTENFFVTSEFRLKLGDFGETISRRPENSQETEKMQIVGTVSYMAPELVAGTRYYTEAVDIYALGITFWEIWTGMECYSGKQTFEIYDIVGRGERPSLDACEGAPEMYITAMKAAWHQDPNQRPSAKTLVHIFEGLVKAAMPESVGFDQIYLRKSSRASFQAHSRTETSSVTKFVLNLVPTFKHTERLPPPQHKLEIVVQH